MGNARRVGRRSRVLAVLTVTAVLALAGLPDGLGSVRAAAPTATPQPAPSSHRFLGGTQPTNQLTPALVAAAETLPSGFQDSVVFSGLTQPTSVRFASDGRIFVAEKSGLIKVFSSLAATTPTIFADLRTQVDNYWDRGLLGMTLAPNFPTDPYVYVLYTLDAKIGAIAPTWNDACPSPPGPTTDGCMVSGRLSRLQASGNVMIGSEQVLINDWCQQFPSHSMGDLRFGVDGALYVSAGEGASFNGIDFGQLGGTSGTTTPKNPCGDPPGGVGGSMTSPTAEGGALRAQSVRRPATQPVALNGAVLRVDPATGLALADNPLASRADARELSASDSATRSASPSNPARTSCGSAMSEMPPGRRSIGSRTPKWRRSQTAAGRATKGRPRLRRSPERTLTCARPCTQRRRVF
jgi:glucose/arabinose dehydrogenase